MSSKFRDILKSHKGEEVTPGDPAPPEEYAAPPPAPVQSPSSEPAPAAKRKERPKAQAVAEPPRRPGRPTGKRSDPNYVQTTSYIRTATHRDVQMKLLRLNKPMDFSELVDALLSKWVKSDF